MVRLKIKLPNSHIHKRYGVIILQMNDSFTHRKTFSNRLLYLFEFALLITKKTFQYNILWFSSDYYTYLKKASR